jgi:phosphatidylinositol 4-kinase
MLLQHLRSAEPTVEAVIAFNLVDLALYAPENAFIDIIRTFSIINRTANSDDPRLSNNMVCHSFEVLHFIRDSPHRVRSLLHRLD